MATRTVSPGGALLRASRVFSISSPLPQPTGDLSSTAVFGSDSATTPYPTHQAITTPQASLKRGDWGFKRPLPLRSTTKSSTPHIKVKAIDTFEHVTEYGSSADHTFSLQKWLEMGVPLSTPVKQTAQSNSLRREQASGKSVFEDSIDTIAPTQGKVAGKDDVRWKFSGPWLAGLTEGEFDTYVLKEVRKRKMGFRNFLRNAYATELTQKHQERAAEAKEDPASALQASDITDEQLTSYIRTLRRDSTSLNKHIRAFLDLPPAPISKASEDFLTDLFRGNAEKALQTTSNSPYAETGPPKTHPSAGLSYNRTASHTFNHPLYGPQRFPPPVQARVVMPRKAATGSFSPLLGVGGFTVDVPTGMTSGFNNPRNDRSGMSGLETIEPDVVGGSKVWVNPAHASIDAKGKVILSVTKADPEAIAVKEGRVADIPTTFGGKSWNLLRSSGIGSPTVPAYSGGYGLERGEAKNAKNAKNDEQKRTRADVDAVKELTRFLDSYETKDGK